MRPASWIVLALVAGCSFDTDRQAPYLAPPKQAGVCGTTETLLPTLLELLRSGHFEPLRSIIESHLVPSSANPSPDPSLRSLLGALVDLAAGLGLERTANTASIAISSQAIRDLRPLILVGLRFTKGELDGTPHYQATEAIAELLERCDNTPLLAAAEAILSFKSPLHQGRLFLSDFGEAFSDLLRDPQLQPFLTGFENDAQRGRPAVIALLDQILTFLADQRFDIARVRTLLDSVVYPAIGESLRGKMERLVDLGEIILAKDAGILEPLQLTVRCLMERPDARHELIGYFFDLITTQQVELSSVIASVLEVVDDQESAKLLTFVADLIHVLRVERDTRQQILGLVVILLKRPEVAEVMPLWIEIFERDVLVEVLDAVATLLSGCGRNP